MSRTLARTYCVQPVGAIFRLHDAISCYYKAHRVNRRYAWFPLDRDRIVKSCDTNKF